MVLVVLDRESGHVILGFSALSSVAIQGIEENDTPWAGALERVSAYGFMVWLVVLAWVTLRPYRAEAEPNLGGAQWDGR
jgi:hypothetical protein